ncbi:hypothetical protein SBRCBS47491_009022 [Sporothrix bragantina]|uniref:Zn(2)-C6 fungal-type domain-containing protein n=1 Tax=Sporothrix bragantina TaxID=671064 RepID=A0ABP0CR97_9PEZI
MSSSAPAPASSEASVSTVAPSQTPRAPSTAPSSSAPPTNTTEPRVLACVMCQQRKVKCNRKFPCNNCIRLGVHCVPATLNPRRRRRRFPERELLDRVRRYEMLLRQNNVRFESLFETVAEGDDHKDQQNQSQNQNNQPPLEEEEASHDAASSLAALRQSGHGSRDGRDGRDGRDEMMVDADADADTDADTICQSSSSAPPSASSDRGYEAKNFWKAIRKGFPDRSEFAVGVGVGGSSSSQANVSDSGPPASAASPASTSDAESDGPHPSTVIREMWARQLGNTGSLFFRRPQQHKMFAQQVTALHPGPAQIFRLWQIYLENVDPLLKITHTPSLQSRIVEAAARPNLEGIDPTLEALMFSIYCVAIHSMAPSDCQAVFGSSKKDLLGTYQPACEQALLNSGFFGTSERDCLAAFFLYLLSLGHGIDHRTLYSMLGAAMRVGQTMQINIELDTKGKGTSHKMAPLEAEMRRRLWWAMALFDSRISELSNHSPTMLDPTWDCSLPLNVNDLDFRPELKEAPRGATGRSASSSEALFAVVRSELGNAMRHMEYYLALSNPALKPMARDRELVATAASLCTTSPDGRPRRKEYAEINALEDMIHDKYLQYCDPANGLHFMTIWVARGFVAKCRLIKYFSKFSQYAFNQPQPSSSASTPTSTSGESLPSMRDIALDDALTVIEADTNIMTSPLTRGYRWLVHLYFPLPAYIYITQELARRISGERAKHVWAVMNSNYEARFALSDSEDRYMFKMFASTILQAWDACEARMRAEGEPEPIDVPEMVSRIRNQLSSNANDEAVAPANSTFTQTLGDNTTTTMDGTGVSGGDMLGGFSTTMSMGMAQPSLFGGGGPPPPGSGPPSAFGGATPPAPPLFPSPNLGGNLNFGMAGLGNWPPMPMAWGWGPRPSWG